MVTAGASGTGKRDVITRLTIISATIVCLFVVFGQVERAKRLNARGYLGTWKPSLPIRVCRVFQY